MLAATKEAAAVTSLMLGSLDFALLSTSILHPFLMPLRCRLFHVGQWGSISAN